MKRHRFNGFKTRGQDAGRLYAALRGAREVSAVIFTLLLFAVYPVLVLAFFFVSP